MKALITCPYLSHIGGVALHYSGLKPYWNEDIRYFYVGNRNGKPGSGKYSIAWRLFAMIATILSSRPDIVLLNTSLNHRGITRDMFYQRIINMLGFKTAIFIHGFSWEEAKTMDHKKIASQFNKASCIFLLAKSFSDELQSWGVTSPMELTTTKVDDRLLKSFDIATKDYTRQTLLYLARVEEEKGIFIALKAFEILKNTYPELKFNIVGKGNALDDVKKYVAERNLKDVRITGALSGDQLIDEFKKATLYIMPSYSEGMPTSVLEAMAFGLPVFTRSVGAIPDMFENGKMGYSTDSFDPEDFANAISGYLKSTELAESVGRYNHDFAVSHFLASKVAKNIETTLKKYC